MHPVDWSWGERVDCGPVFAPAPQPVPTSYFPPVISLQSSSTALPKPSAMAAAGRKRSRDETLTEEDYYDSSDMSRASASPPKIRPTGLRQDSQVEYGPGVTLLDPNNPVAALQAGSQNGTWAEEVSEQLRSSSIDESQRLRPMLEARKSARLHRDVPDVDNVRASWFAKHQDKSSLDTPGAQDLSGRIQLDEPEYDAASIALGVGWALIPSSDAMQAAIRGWTAFLEQRYPLTNVKFEWQKRSDPKAYLVGAVSRSSRTPGYFLFQEDLQCGKLVAKSWERALDNLRTLPMRFDDDTELLATDPAVIAAEQRERERTGSLARVTAANGSMDTDAPSMAEPYITNGMQGHIHQGHSKVASSAEAALMAVANQPYPSATFPVLGATPSVGAQAVPGDGGGMDLD
ncbi:hypothetical protein FH972_023619 [Carpinus fangiana]|uniref:Uncharacterized protein n=1 Tax=Carpinus fangiana TaxID=176857 RepID=A0A5N6KVP7_9ROSI|nr:hypothetical protein FH972_023619 [Carpinus fangiana]